jgi:serine/threonine protein phosphatase PrpC
MSFDVDIGHASRRGARDVNEDCAGVRRSADGDAVRGVIAAVADGVSSGGRGREAAQTAVLGLLADWFATPPTWETTVALDRLIGAHNAWLVAHNRRHEGTGVDTAALTTLSALVLHGQGWTVAHVGDTRVWRIAGGEIQLLTHDHAWTHPDQRSRLTRALGLDDGVRVDYLQGDAAIGDVYLLTSDGVHGALRPRRLTELATQGDSAQQASDALVDAALAAGARDNASAVVVRVRGLDAARLGDATARARALPALPRLRPGDVVDRYTVIEPLADTGVHRVYQARDGASQALVVLKTLHESRAADAEERAMLVHEAWLAQRVTERDARGFVRARDTAGATALYTVYDWHAGRTLEQWLDEGRRFEAGEVVEAAVAIARALARLHRQGVIHRDVKPAHLHLGDDGQWRLLDLGVALSGCEGAAARELHAGTPSYINPEQWRGSPADAASDLYALGVTLYRALTGRLPYGDIEPYQLARYRRDPQPPSSVRPDVPIWLDHLVLKAVALDARQRFETAEELLLALERGASRPVGVPAPTPLVARDPLVLWKIVAGLSLLLNALLVYWLLFLPR